MKEQRVYHLPHVNKIIQYRQHCTEDFSISKGRRVQQILYECSFVVVGKMKLAQGLIDRPKNKRYQGGARCICLSQQPSGKALCSQAKKGLI